MSKLLSRAYLIKRITNSGNKNTLSLSFDKEGFEGLGNSADDGSSSSEDSSSESESEESDGDDPNWVEDPAREEAKQKYLYDLKNGKHSPTLTRENRSTSHSSLRDYMSEKEEITKQPREHSAFVRPTSNRRRMQHHSYTYVRKQPAPTSPTRNTPSKLSVASTSPAVSGKSTLKKKKKKKKKSTTSLTTSDPTDSTSTSKTTKKKKQKRRKSSLSGKTVGPTEDETFSVRLRKSYDITDIPQRRKKNPGGTRSAAQTLIELEKKKNFKNTAIG